MRPALLIALVLAILAAIPARGQVSSLTGYLPPGTPLCANTTIPAGNTSAATTETAFATTCTLKAGSAFQGLAVHLHVHGLYSAGTAQNARGRIHYSNGAAQNIASDPVIIDTGTVGGLAAGTNQEWWGDVWITFLSATTIQVAGVLLFQSGTATAFAPVGNVSTFPVDPTKDIVFYTTVQWGGTGNSMTLQAMVAK